MHAAMEPAAGRQEQAVKALGHRVVVRTAMEPAVERRGQWRAAADIEIAYPLQ